MGPALREGYWNPEDYKDCGDNYIDEINIFKKFEDSDLTALEIKSEKEDNINHFIWDDESFEDEFNCTYTAGVAGELKKHYPYIDLSSSRFSSIFMP